MDKVRTFLRIVWQQRFWLLAVVCVLAGVICWKLGSGALDAAFATNKASIEGQFSNMQAISNKSVHGNNVVNAKELEEARKIRAGALQLWKSLYDKQREAVLKWPAELGDDFLAKIERKQFGDKSIDPDMRNIYLNYIKKRFPKLVKIVEAKELSATEASGYGGGGRGGYGGAPVDAGLEVDPRAKKYLVEWLDQGTLRTKLDFPSQPSPLQIWVTQEDLWVYETLLHIIADTNDERGATRPDNTAVRAIEAMQVGPDAATALATPGTILMPASADAAGAPMEESPRGAGYPGAEGATEADVQAMLLGGRYLGEDGKPAASAEINTTDGFRMLPVHLTLVMDHRYLPVLLVKCANATLPVEVKRVRINPDKSGLGFDAAMAATAAPAASGGEGYGGRGGGYGGGFSGYSGARGGGAGYGGGVSTFQMPTGPGATNLARVQIDGIVYIYNPPNGETLSIPGDEAEAAPEDVAVAASGAGS